MPTTITMQTVPHRDRISAETRSLFAAAGAPVHCVARQTEPVSNRMNAVNAHRAMREAVRQKRQAILLIEDDLIPASTLPEWLEYLEYTRDYPVALYLASERFFPESMQNAARGAAEPDPPPHVGVVQHLNVWWGSQAVWMPQAIAEEYLDQPRVRNDAEELRTFDGEFREFLQKAQLPLGVTFPNVVQHANERNLISPQKQIHRSRCYRADVKPPVIPAR